jgi:hypothetical protein
MGIRNYAAKHDLGNFAEEMLNRIATGDEKAMRLTWKTASTLTREQATTINFCSAIADYLIQMTKVGGLQGQNPPNAETLQHLQRMMQGSIIASRHIDLLTSKQLASTVFPPKTLIGGRHRYNEPLTLLLDILNEKPTSEEAAVVKRLISWYVQAGQRLEPKQVGELGPLHKEYYETYLKAVSSSESSPQPSSPSGQDQPSQR